ncbi:dolichyl pyrophosphate Man9GlcNAc2 alpha-1,3-glucosyltransferase-like [Gigantopelta aegis]|uniref:dolichyl pyrophosphate Man9GlcNAc2 alpha-1,3-glucosyltransferase-like n=1 Tax=Gigantopelta aegis TaxID=1735272 RepID=UPI001B889BB3|nr:dolichyl pyrophosphate Man9GlcNAc2 alpha-1,3-glucosyltransferase-like [Gigantopelta aegis]
MFIKLCILTIISILLRWCISLNSYSGAGKAPMFGDYEAQRHWMEITINLPSSEWYKNTTNNDLLYWGLDYPPLTAYHSYLCGLLSRYVNPDWVALNKSRGFESEQHKLFMRYSVIIADLVVFIPAVLFYWISHWRLLKSEKLGGVLTMLLYPGLILIDHGHFQYNSVSLGAALLGMACIVRNQDLWAAILFCLALNYKQMELYHALPFFSYLLGSCFTSSPTKGYLKFSMLVLVVLITFGVCWLPFLQDLNTAQAVVKRLFPFGRGLYEDKVANVWCSLSVMIKLKKLLPVDKLVYLCLGSTAVLLLPSSIHLLVKPTVENFKLALINSSLVFFLFSFQVHEKSVLLAAMPVMAIFPVHQFGSTWFLLLSTFSMLPLLIKDGLFSPYVSLTCLFFIASIAYMKQTGSKQYQKVITIVLFTASMLGVAVLTVVAKFSKPPQHLPDMFAMLISVYSCGHFIVFLFYFHYLQFFQTSAISPLTQSPKKLSAKKIN